MIRVKLGIGEASLRTTLESINQLNFGEIRTFSEFKQNLSSLSGGQGADPLRGGGIRLSGYLQQRIRERARRHRGPSGGAKRPPDAEGPQ